MCVCINLFLYLIIGLVCEMFFYGKPPSFMETKYGFL
jgi:hypothetical protein